MSRSAVNGSDCCDLQRTCEAGNATSTSIQFGNDNETGVGHELTTNGVTSARLSYNGVVQYVLAAGGAGFFSDAPTGTRPLGSASHAWKRAFVNHQAGGVADVGDASFAADDETFIRVRAALGARTITLPSAVVGYWYLLDVAGVGVQVLLDDQAGDTINGGAGPIVLHGGAGFAQLYLVYCRDGTDWITYQIG